ncbi:maleylpyruvate isomerase N-terminal domain-containing protein [Streptomyces sp. NPDC001795]|uniref:maleylpyruvate isomerase N-terminal domain-containing protein n=1 Tax=Streptomyces sp. NPDC001795 TaxID=3154525 RepID=UPI003325A2BB
MQEGAGRGAAELVADLRGSVERLLDEATAVPAEPRPTPVTALAGRRHPAWFTLHRAWRELETHHVDLRLGHTTADWPVDYVTWALDGTIAALTARGFPVAHIEATDLNRAWSPAPTGPAVTGPGHVLLAWPTGRDGHAGLQWDLPLPTPPAWPLPPAPGWS